MTTTEAMKLALEALKQIDEAMPFPVAKLAQSALREALAEQPTDWEAVAADQAMTIALLRAEQPAQQRHISYACPQCHWSLEEQPAQQQEPVAWLIWLHGPAGHFDHKQFAELEFERRNKEYPDPDRKLLPLYTSPPAQRTWVDLTDDEIKKEFHPLHATGLQFARAVLAKSKEKNA